MEVEALDGLDWSDRWFAPFGDVGRTIVWGGDWRDQLSREAQKRSIRNEGGRALCFVAADAAGAEPYEAFIARTGEVPTREVLHDAFNALVWVRFPALKARLNSVQAAMLARDGVRSVRGELRDALTLIDENAVLLVTRHTDLPRLLQNHDWSKLFVERRRSWGSDVDVIAFGHALLQKLVHPYKAITAHALHIAISPEAALHELDRCAAKAIGEDLTPAVLMPVPVLGIPGWFPQNDDPDFYSDPTVFRPVKIRREFQRRKSNQ